MADSSLFFKLSAIYPSWTASQRKRCLVLGPFIVTLVIRLILSFLTIWYHIGLILPKVERGGSINGVSEETDVLGILRFLDIGLQFLSCAYVSSKVFPARLLSTRTDKVAFSSHSSSCPPFSQAETCEKPAPGRGDAVAQTQPSRRVNPHELCTTGSVPTHGCSGFAPQRTFGCVWNRAVCQNRKCPPLRFLRRPCNHVVYCA